MKAMVMKGAKVEDATRNHMQKATVEGTCRRRRDLLYMSCQS